MFVLLECTMHKVGEYETMSHKKLYLIALIHILFASLFWSGNFLYQFCMFSKIIIYTALVVPNLIFRVILRPLLFVL